MIPRTFPSTYASNGQQQMLVHFLTDVTGLQRWSDYIPVKLAQTGTENSYANDGYIDVKVLSPLTASTQAWKEYIPVYVDDEATDAWTVNATGYIPYGYALFGDASMQLDLTNGGYLDPRITFSRTSNATVTGPDGLIAYAPHNLLTYSEQFDNAAWGKLRSTVSANVLVAPNGTTTADKQIATSVSGTHKIFASASYTGQQGTASVYAKAAGYNWLFLVFSAAGDAGAYFDLSTGQVGAISSGYTASITSEGDGWYRCSVSTTTTAASWFLNTLVASANNVSSFVGNDVDGILIWGAQLNVGALQPYYPTTVKNLLGYTQEFDNAAWAKTRSSITANATTDPQGFMTADKLVEDTTATNSHLFSATITSTTGVNTFSVFAKAAERPRLQLRFAGGSDVRGAAFNLLTGTVEAETISATTQANNPSITDVGNGWYRCSIDSAGTGDTTVQGYLDNGTSHSYTGDGVSGIFIWGAQLSDSASLDQYVYNPGAAPSAAAYYGPRFDYDPVTLAPKGLLIEESRTNLFTYSEQFDNAAWAKVDVSVAANGEVAPDGTTTGDTATVSASTGSKSLQQTISFVNGQPYTLSVFAKKGTLNFIQLRVGNGAGGAFANFNLDTGVVGTLGKASGNDPTSSITSIGSGWYRCTMSVTVNATASSTTGVFFVSSASAPSAENWTAAGTETVFLWGAQLESASFSSSYIPTTTAAATRAADVATMIGANFSNWYNATEGTLFSEASTYDVSNARVGFSISDNTAPNRIQVGHGGGARIFISTGGVTQLTQTLASVTLFNNTASKIALAYELNNGNGALNGTIGTLDTSMTIPTVTQAQIGGLTATLLPLNGHVRRLAYFPRRLSDAELQGITS